MTISSSVYVAFLLAALAAAAPTDTAGKDTMPAAQESASEATAHDTSDAELSESHLKALADCIAADSEEVCSPDGKRLRREIPQELTNECANCGERTKRQTRALVRYLMERRRDDFMRLEARYDPHHTYLTKHATSSSSSVLSSSNSATITNIGHGQGLGTSMVHSSNTVLASSKSAAMVSSGSGAPIMGIGQQGYGAGIGYGMQSGAGSVVASSAHSGIMSSSGSSIVHQQ